MSSIGLPNNHIIMRNYANPWYTHNYRLVDPSLDNETHTARRYHTLENTDFKYDLKFEISSDLTKELTYIEDYPNGMIIDDLKLRGKIKPFHEQTQPISVNPREQMKFCPTNFYNNGRYKGSEFAFEFKVKIIFSKIIRYRSWLDLRDHDLWELDRVPRIYPFKDPQPTIHKRDILPNKADRSHKEGTWYGSFFWPDYAGKDFKIPNEQLHRKDHYWVTEDEIDKVKSSEEILYEFFKDKYLVDYHTISTTTKFIERGIKYSELKEEDREEYENLFEEGEVQEEISSNAINSWLFNRDTIKIILETVMQKGLKVEGGDKLRKNYNIC